MEEEDSIKRIDELPDTRCTRKFRHYLCFFCCNLLTSFNALQSFKGVRAAHHLALRGMKTEGTMICSYSPLYIRRQFPIHSDGVFLLPNAFQCLHYSGEQPLPRCPHPLPCISALHGPPRLPEQSLVSYSPKRKRKKRKRRREKPFCGAFFPAAPSRSSQVSLSLRRREGEARRGASDGGVETT